jgi:hypothetical protein
MQAFRCITESGSTYDVKEDAVGRFWLRGDNVATPVSCKLNGSDWWEIDRVKPWPPKEGQKLYTCSAHFHEPKDHPKRMPGGGKHTSVVVDVKEIT